MLRVAETTRRPAPDGAGASCRDWTGHIVVCGLGDVGLRTVEQLHSAGARVAVLDERRDGRFARIVRSWGIPVIVREAHLAEPFFDAGIELSLIHI